MNNTENNTNQYKPSGCFRQMFKDKNGCYSLRELATVILLLAIIASWLGKQFFSKEVPEFMFYSFASLIGAGCFGYSIERKTIIDNKN
jgi:choline-glycine betaine transporter